jgi:hypothetical protein
MVHLPRTPTLLSSRLVSLATKLRLNLSSSGIKSSPFGNSVEIQICQGFHKGGRRARYQEHDAEYVRKPHPRRGVDEVRTKLHELVLRGTLIRASWLPDVQHLDFGFEPLLLLSLIVTSIGDPHQLIKYPESQGIYEHSPEHPKMETSITLQPEGSEYDYIVCG